MGFFFQSAYFSIEADQVKNDSCENGKDHRYHNVDLSILPHGIRHGNGFCLLLGKRKDAGNQRDEKE
jgi:hypothetical protein